MATNLLRFKHNGKIQWGVVQHNAITPLSGTYATTGELIEQGEQDWRAAKGQPSTLKLSDVEMLSPITAPARLICQGANYRQHMIESGMNPDEKVFNMFFEKADCSIAPPVGKTARPSFVNLLDYEIELTLVFKKAITGPITLTPDNFHDYIFGLTIANDLSARDIQIPQMQFFKGKSYRGFCPFGPYISVLDKDEFSYLDMLTLTLKVNGEIRQHDETRNLVYKPLETVTEMSHFSDVAAGDVLLTGTPSGCALRLPPPKLRKFMQFLLPETAFWEMFKKNQAKSGKYLQPGDVIMASIASADRKVDLGEQRTEITQG